MSADRITDAQADRFLDMIGSDLFVQEAVQETLSAYIRQLREDVGWRESVLNEVRATLEALDGPSPHTPPMMFPEWIKCVVAHRTLTTIDMLIRRVRIEIEDAEGPKAVARVVELNAILKWLEYQREAEAP